MARVIAVGTLGKVRTELCRMVIKKYTQIRRYKAAKEMDDFGESPQQQQGLQLQLFRETGGGKSRRKPGTSPQSSAR